MRRRVRGLVLTVFIGGLVGAAGCGDDDDDGYRCREACGPKRPYCAPNGACVECVYDGDCGPGQRCNADYECKG